MIGNCDVCGKEGEVYVGSSACGAISFAYCIDCINGEIEPYFAIVASLIGIRDMDGVAKWYRPIIRASLAFYNKTTKELFEDVQKAEDDFDEYCRTND